jgi:hypothetical protein
MHTLPPSFDFETRLLCYYRNATPKIQVIRISNIDQWYFERVVFPGGDLMFEAPPTAELEIYAGGMTNLLAERLPCRNLEVLQPVNSPSEQRTF